jgi:hypothetical protein
MNQMEMLEIVEQFSRKVEGVENVEGQMKVLRVPDFKTVYVETIGDIGRSIFLREYKVDGKTYWAGYSSRSDTVFVSQSG